MTKIDYTVCPRLKNLIDKLYLTNEVKAVFLCGSRARKSSRAGSDYDLLVFNTWDLQKLQVVHYDIHGLLIDFMLLNTNFIFSKGNVKKRLFKVLLKDSKLIFSKSKNIQNEVSRALNKYTPHASEMENETIWYNILWNLKKAESFLGINKDFSNQLCIETQYFIGLFFAKLHHKEIYNFSGSLGFMMKKHPQFFKKYSNLNNKNRLQELENIVKALPNYKKYSSLESCAELDGFLSPHTVIEDRANIKNSTKKLIDRIVFSSLK